MDSIEATLSYISDSGLITVWSTDNNNSRKLEYLTFIFKNPRNT
jgi:hypothetical protein